MPINAERARQHLKKGDLPTLFREELGWDNCKTVIPIPASNEHYELRGIAEKRGFVAFQCQASDGKSIPPYQTRRKLEKELAKYVREHIVIYLDHDGSTQIWQWVKREPEKPVVEAFGDPVHIECRADAPRDVQDGDPGFLLLQADQQGFELLRQCLT